MNDIIKKIQNQIQNNPIIIYMKGSPDAPSCGFSAQAVHAISSCGKKFAYIDVLKNPDIRLELPKYANWPTFPQLWVNGELIGGCNIILELFQKGELKKTISICDKLNS
ncbi:thioredoxin-like protein 2 [Buchnera aphidicola str. Bp (Baizongia pistaciae)]|uniref:Glutaredoxin 4 n=1 Tax=Buchnera aphidicola subsp. Baizongia pistaciae (strain Bp) TaxID=224915 RepID=GLRX4_BUCBP|nr:Grx4 family monothiol glutaredoxin [Buchnera aphidicola]Q89AR8.1 RecName: Full=Glutaredoxin 4; Short=Grx4; AltName: Full=Monothiol glutaredoxin [Buchnera aphidicola str. Bp (Baizongia pistaciae)]AAO26908.1 thioredoxin-like protein 2 [Buchnera aphidicola str. Bp (Baizongia pistaciae)]